MRAHAGESLAAPHARDPSASPDDMALRRRRRGLLLCARLPDFFLMLLFRGERASACWGARGEGDGSRAAERLEPIPARIAVLARAPRRRRGLGSRGEDGRGFGPGPEAGPGGRPGS